MTQPFAGTQSPEPRLATLAIHGGQAPEPLTGSIMPPIFQTSTYVQPGLDQGWPWEYARVQNPTREALERNVAALEGGSHGIAFASGMAAIDCVARLLSAGDHVVCEENTYGGTTRLATQVLNRAGLSFSFVDSRDPQRIRDALRPNTRLVLLETPTNPMMRLCDLRAAADATRDAGVLLCVDNTFATPVNQRPHETGADIVMHSTTKYLNGHSDIIGGVLTVRDPDLDERLRFLRKSTGAVPGPMDCWLCLRGTKTLHVRMREHNANGLAVARFLEAHPTVEEVHYPGLSSHPQHELAARQMTGFSGMVSVTLPTEDAVRRLVEGTRIFALAESLGGVESLISVPALMTHASVPRERREEMGVSGRVVRLSVGIEDPQDLLEDLGRALGRGPGG
ncbi:MAG: PLP-dependent aspartate aminotransferase family protein [Gammaproteobacteria bacterium]|nr:PLP-dependent aspartate aminotransferase family protein [Gammaproteobacteria bacterium]MDE0259235.1 PLP-dependent aspartate aminotransferase family protein [Gammaproteobacteria bacterium]